MNHLVPIPQQVQAQRHNGGHQGAGEVAAFLTAAGIDCEGRHNAEKLHHVHVERPAGETAFVFRDVCAGDWAVLTDKDDTFGFVVVRSAAVEALFVVHPAELPVAVAPDEDEQVPATGG